MRTQYYIIWVEGLSWKQGEKIKSVSQSGIEYTCQMTDAMRIKGRDIARFKSIMAGAGVADWVINGSNTFIKTNYVPAGTLWNGSGSR